MPSQQHELFDLSGQVALVTGAATGIGKEIAFGLARQGADIVVSDIDLDGIRSVVETIQSEGRRAIGIQCDNAEPKQIHEMFIEIDRSIGMVNILINNVGIIVRQHPEEMTVEEWEKVIKVNLTGTFLCSQEAGKRMIAAGGGGCIISISSIAGWTALGRGNFAYSVSKGAINQLTRELAVEWAKYGIRVNAILPAQVRTTYLQRLTEDPNFDADSLIHDILKGIPLNRIGEPSDIVGPVVFLASDAAAFITGALIPVDGGNTALNAGGSKDW